MGAEVEMVDFSSLRCSPWDFILLGVFKMCARSQKVCS